jgi:SAM-dependent methyltransferase
VRLTDFHFLLSSEGQQLLSEIAATPIDAQNHLRIAGNLSRQIGPERTHALLETVLLRQRAARKFNRADEMYFTRQALQQASAEVVSTYRAKRFAQAGFKRLADLGCGIGGDSLALAARSSVVGVDMNPLRLLMARENLRLHGCADHFMPLQADLLEISPMPVEAIFADPGRRTEQGRRINSVYNYRPPITFLDRWRRRVPHQAVKISPGVDYAELPDGAEVEFISVAGEVREGVLWFGALRTQAGRRATLLPEGETLTDEPVENVVVTRPKAYLYEPDGAVIRAHLVEQLAQRLGASKIDDTIAYLTAEHFRPTLFARCYVIEDVFPFQLKRLRHYLRERGIGEVTIKKRGSALDPDVLRRQLRLSGGDHSIVFLTRVMGEPSVLIGRAQSGGEQP